MATVLYSALRGESADDKTKSLAASYSQNLFVSAWRDQSDSSTQAYANRFFEELQEIGKSTRLIERWQHAFDQQQQPRSADSARAFISDFLQTHLHYPRTYHDFVCQRRDIHRDAIMDFPIEHPIAVEFWAIYVTVAGHGTVSAEGDSTELATGNIAIVPPGCSCNIHRSSGAQYWKYDWLSFRSRLEWTELLAWATELTRPMFITVDEPASFRHLLYQTKQLENTTYRKDSLSERLCNNVIENFLIRIRLLVEAEGGGNSQLDSRLQKAVNYILNHYEQDLTLELVAAKVNISPSRLSAIFREHFGISVIKWRDHIRMQKAREMIMNSNEPIGNIALLVGYTDPLYFSRRFKDHFSVAPTAFRHSKPPGHSRKRP